MGDARFINSAATARKLGVPEAWLKREGREGRVPCLRAGRRLLFDVEAVERALSERAENQAQGREARA